MCFICCYLNRVYFSVDSVMNAEFADQSIHAKKSFQPANAGSLPNVLNNFVIKPGKLNAMNANVIPPNALTVNDGKKLRKKSIAFNSRRSFI